MTNDILNGVWPEWQFVRQLGKGSFGTVYEVVRKDYDMESHAAVKVISIPQSEAELDSLRAEGLSINASKTYLRNVVNDFVSEIKLMESFKGIQNIVSVEDYKIVEKTDQIGWDIYIRMELLTTFSSYLGESTMSEKDVIKLGCDICTALELCAKRNVIHRDIKPENIFVNQFGDFKLGDFGIARKMENASASLSQKRGAYNYMAPEVARSTHYDARVDIYSLGLVLYRLMNKNRLPFLYTEQQLLNPNERMKAVSRRMDGEPLPGPCDASPQMAEIILCASAHDPNKRFATAAAMKKALLSAAENVQNNDEKAAQTVSVEPQILNVQTLDETISVSRASQQGYAAGRFANVSAEKKNVKRAAVPSNAYEDKPDISKAVQKTNDGDNGKKMPATVDFIKNKPGSSFKSDDSLFETLGPGFRGLGFETILKCADGIGKYKEKSSLYYEYAVVQIRVEPVKDRNAFYFVNDITDGSLHRNHIPIIEKEIREIAKRGIIPGYPIVGVKVILYDGIFHPIASTKEAFENAARLAFQDAVSRSVPAFVEAIGLLTLNVQYDKSDTVIAIITNIMARRGIIKSNHAIAQSTQHIEAEVPVSEMGDFRHWFELVSNGKGKFTFNFIRYDQAPEGTIIES